MSATKSLTEEDAVLSLAHAAVCVRSTSLPGPSVVIRGYDFNNGVEYDKFFQCFMSTGFQATNFGLAIEEVNRMIRWRLSDEPITPDEKEDWKDPNVRSGIRCKIFLAYTSNMVSSGVRETIRFLVEHRMVDVVVATAGGVEEDIIKCLKPSLLGSFDLPGAQLRAAGLNRIGNVLVPNDNYCAFEEWLMPILDALLHEQRTQGVVWSPSKVIARLGKEINNPDSIYYWAQKHGIPCFCPAITDGSLGDMIYFHSYRNPGLIIDLVQDIRGINSEAVFAAKTGMVILGGGVIKHHTCNANLMRNGADFSVFINTAADVRA